MFEVELVDFGEKDAKEKYPRLSEFKGEAPEQYPDYEDE